MNYELVAWALVLLAVADWGATVSLIRGALELKEAALQERAIVAVILSVAASGAALLSVAYLAHYTFPDGIGTMILIAVLLAISLPQLLWYGAYRARRFS